MISHLTTYLRKHPKKHLIFDFDQTLFHLHLPWKKFIDFFLKELAEFRPLVTSKDYDQSSAVINHAVQKYGNRIREKYLPWIAKFELEEQQREPTENTELMAFIEEYRDKYDYSIWSSNMSSTILPILKQRGIDRLFKPVASRDAVILTKPYPDGFAVIKKATKLLPKDYLFIGDSRNDAYAAAAAGIDHIKVKLQD